MRTLQEVRKNLYMAIEDDKDFFQTYQNLKVQEFEVAEDVWVPYHVVIANDRDIVKHIDLENVGTIHDVCGPVILVDEKILGSKNLGAYITREVGRIMSDS